MSKSIDLTGCEDEPITIPGSIQSHGVLLVLRRVTLIVVQISANSLEFLGDPFSGFGYSQASAGALYAQTPWDDSKRRV